MTTDDRAYCWGFYSLLRPAVVPGGNRFRYVNPGAVQACGVTLSGVPLCWPSGNGTPVAVRGGLLFSGLGVSTIGFHMCGVTPGHRAYCWGENSAGQLGDGTTTARETPVPVLGPS